MPKMTDPKYLRARADEYEKNGDETAATALRNEADELEKSTSQGDATQQ